MPATYAKPPGSHKSHRAATAARPKLANLHVRRASPREHRWPQSMKPRDRRHPCRRLVSIPNLAGRDAGAPGKGPKARHVIARPVGPGKPFRKIFRGLKGRHHTCAVDVPPLQGGRELFDAVTWGFARRFTP